MAPLTYAAPSYALGDDNLAATKGKAKAALKAMQASLRRWLRYRNIMNAAACGTAPKPLLRPGVRAKSACEIGQTLRQERYGSEQKLANSLHALLTECGASASSLPNPDVAADADVAAKLADIAIAGRCPEDSALPTSTGLIWWLIAIPVAGAVLIASQFIKGQADLALEQEKNRCIAAGACTDSGFWMKVGAIAVVGWLAWDKFGLREAARRLKA